MGEKIHFVFFCGPEPRSASELLLAHVLFLTMQLQFLIKRLGDSVFVWAHTTEGDKSWMGKLKWLCSGSFIHESVHLRAINQELFAEGKKVYLNVMLHDENASCECVDTPAPILKSRKNRPHLWIGFTFMDVLQKQVIWRNYAISEVKNGPKLWPQKVFYQFYFSLMSYENVCQRISPFK